MNKTTRIVLLTGVCLCAICAVFPPRRINNTSSFQFVTREDGKFAPYDVPRAFLFSPEFGIYRAAGGTLFPAEVDGGRLLAQLVLIGTLTGGVVLVPSFSQSRKNERSGDA
jgi:hypothetical protein